MQKNDTDKTKTILMAAQYIAKPDTWFKEGTVAELIEYLYTDGENCKYGLFEGTYVVAKTTGYDKIWINKGYKLGDEVKMNEVCAYDEFERIEI